MIQTRHSLRVLVLVPYPPDQAPSQRFRIEQWIPHLRTHGIECHLVPFMDDGLYERLTRRGHTVGKAVGLLRAAVRRWDILNEVEGYDVILLHREAIAFGPAILERLIARRKPVVFDFDDAIWLRSQNRVNPLAKWMKFPSKTRSIASRASAILAGNRYLAEWAQGYNRSAYMVPTTLDTNGLYSRQKTHGPCDVPVVGWSGSISTLRYLEILRPVLEELAWRRRFRLRVIYNGPAVHWPGVEMDWRPWNSGQEVEDLLGFDVGLMPQPDEEWAKGKCGLKALQYMALGIPCVASRNGVLPEIIEDGRSGFLAVSPAEWLEHLQGLLDDWKLRDAMGEQARTTVQERYSAALHVPRIASILRSAARVG